MSTPQSSGKRQRSNSPPGEQYKEEDASSPWMGAKEINNITKQHTMYWEDVDQQQSEEILRIIWETKLIAYAVGSASYDQDRRELLMMTASLDKVTINEERQALEHYWNEGDQPGRFNRTRGFSLAPPEGKVVTLCAGNPDIPHAINLAGILEGIKEASGLVLGPGTITMERIDKTPTWKVTTDLPATAELILSVGGILINYEEYFISDWLNLSETHFVVNIKGVPIQVKPKELALLILDYSNITVKEIEFVKKKGVYQNYVHVNTSSEEDRTKLISTSPAPLLSGLPPVQFIRPATADQIKKWQEADESRASRVSARLRKQTNREEKAREAIAKRKKAVEEEEAQARTRVEEARRRVQERLEQVASAKARAGNL